MKANDTRAKGMVFNQKAGEYIQELEAENAELRGLMSEALSNMEYYPASLGEHGLVQDSDITAMQEALQESDDAQT